MNSSYLDAVLERVVIFDGATGTNLQLEGLGPDDFGGPALEGCNEILVETRPEVIKRLHASFFEVGVDVVETDSFGSIPIVLSEYGIAERAYELNLQAAKLAKEVASDFSNQNQKWVAGSMGPGTKLPSLGQISFDELVETYEIQALGLIDGGVDLLLIETCYDLLQVKAAIVASRQAFEKRKTQLPIQVQVTMETTGRMLLGTEIGAALCSIDAMRPQIIGLNCATGPAEMGEHLRHLSSHSRYPISCLPNAGLPSVVEGKMHYDLTPEQLANSLFEFVTKLGVSVIGGCCGTSPQHLKAVVEKCSNLEVPKRKIEIEPGAASIYSNVPFEQDISFLAIGERTNANGSKKFRELMLAKEWDGATQMGIDQVKEGAHLIDLCVDYVGADGVSDMHEAASRFATQVSLPLVLDSTEAEVIEAGLKWIGGRAVLNSVNLEDGDGDGTRFDKFLKLAKKFGAAVICTCIDTDGQARTKEWKLKAAKSIYDIAINKYGLEPSDLLFDALALPLGTGMEESRRDGIETIEGIKLIKSELPGAFTVLGLSNVSFGLNPAARHVLNSVFLHECIEAGLDAAIVHAGRILPLNKIEERHKQICLDLIYDKRVPSIEDGTNAGSQYDPLAELLREFEGKSATVTIKEDKSGWTIEKILSQRIIDGEKDGIEADLEVALQKLSALEIVNNVLLEGMKVVGELFGSGQMQLPFVLQSAETMKMSVSYLEKYMEKSDTTGKGKIVLATVKGDVHDIGKNLVDIILTNNGYEVHNLGIKVALSEMIAKVEEVQADVIGMSGLLVKSTLIMKENLEELNSRELFKIPILLGGAALTRTYVEHDLRELYKGRVFYGKDAFEGLHTMDNLMDILKGKIEDDEFGRKLTARALPMGRRERAQLEYDKALEEGIIPSRSPEVETNNEVFRPPFLGSKIAKGLPLEEISTFLNETALYRNQWGFRPDKNQNEDDHAFKERIRNTLREQMSIVKTKDLLIPQVVWGYFAANSVGNEVIIYSDESRSKEIERFAFPRQGKHPYLCIADFFKSVDSKEEDFIGFHLVTMGPKVSEETAKLFSENKFTDYLLLHGLGVEMTEALAEYWHKRIREEWGFVDQDGPSLAGLFKQQYRGGRYSFGYDACPNLEDNEKVANLLEAQRIGVSVSEGFQLHPEQSTLALICHHPKAKYFIAP